MPHSMQKMHSREWAPQYGVACDAKKLPAYTEQMLRQRTVRLPFVVHFNDELFKALSAKGTSFNSTHEIGL